MQQLHDGRISSLNGVSFPAGVTELFLVSALTQNRKSARRVLAAALPSSRLCTTAFAHTLPPRRFAATKPNIQFKRRVVPRWPDLPRAGTARACAAHSSASFFFWGDRVFGHVFPLNCVIFARRFLHAKSLCSMTITYRVSRASSSLNPYRFSAW